MSETEARFENMSVRDLAHEAMLTSIAVKFYRLAKSVGPRFDAAAGGYPNTVDEMLKRAKAESR